MDDALTETTELIHRNVAKEDGMSAVPGTFAEETPVFGFIFIGIVGMLCFNFFLQVVGFLAEITRPSFIAGANTLYGLSSNLGQVIAIFAGPRMSFHSRIWISCVTIASVAIAYPLLVNSHVPMGFLSGLLITFIMGFGNATIQSASFGLAGMVSPSALNYVSLGQSIAGVVTWPIVLILQYMFAAAGFSTTALPGRPSKVDTASVFTGFVVVGLVTLSMIPYYLVSLSRSPAVIRATQQLKYRPSVPPAERRSVFEIIGSTLPLGLTVWIVLFTTFLVFPSVMLSWRPSYSSYPGGPGFYGSMLIYVFQVFDAVGRLFVVAGLRLSSLQVKMLAPWRFLLALMFYGAALHLPILKFDSVKIILVALFAVSNGILISWAMILGPGQARPHEADIASYIMSFFLVSGIFFGSMTALMIGTTKSITPVMTDGAEHLMILVGSDQKMPM